MLKLDVTQFGPINHGSVRLRPLNIFVGPNNAGKSYMATLMYAIFRSLQRSAGIPPRFSLMREAFFLEPRYYFGLGWEHAIYRIVDKKTAQAVKTWVQSIPETAEEKVTLSFGDLPEDIRGVLRGAIDQVIQEFISSLGEELRRCFGSEIGELAGLQVPVNGGLRVSIEEQKRHWVIALAASDNKLYPAAAELDLDHQSLELPSWIRRIAIAKRTPTLGTVAEVLGSLLAQALRPFMQSFPAAAYYLPAARSGILQSHKALAGFVVSRSPLAGIERLDIPRLSGVVADFIANLLTLERRKKTELHDIATFLEKEVISGEVDIDVGRVEYPEIYYKSDAGKFPLHRTSSMVSELAPIVLFLKYTIRPGDFLVIEEPESHLHPAVQRKLAQAIPRLIRANVSVLVTSHSDYFLEQLSNIVRLSGASEEQRQSWGYAATDYLDPNEVGAYLFDLDRGQGRSMVKELRVTRRDGIPAEELSLVAEQLYGETVQLDRRIKV